MWISAIGKVLTFSFHIVILHDEFSSVRSVCSTKTGGENVEFSYTKSRYLNFFLTKDCLKDYNIPNFPGTQKTGSNILAQINARLMPNKQHHHQQQQQQQQQSNTSSKSIVYQQQAYQENRGSQQSSFQQPVYGSASKSSLHQTYTQPKQSFSYLEDKQPGYWHESQPQQSQQPDGNIQYPFLSF